LSATSVHKNTGTATATAGTAAVVMVVAVTVISTEEENVPTQPGTPVNISSTSFSLQLQ
jgi:hypothetical protein